LAYNKKDVVMFRMNGLPWLSDEPDRKELERLNLGQLLTLASRKKRGLKKVLVDYLMTFKKL
jgi:hypothetical protein